MNKIEKRNNIMADAVALVRVNVASHLSTRWGLGSCLQELWETDPVLRPDNDTPCYDKAIAALSGCILKETGQEYGKGSWLHWRMMAERIPGQGIIDLAAKCVTEHEAMLAVYRIGDDAKVMAVWISQVSGGVLARNHYTKVQDRKRRKAVVKQVNHGEVERRIFVEPPLDEDKLLNLFRSVLRFSVLGGMCVDDVDRAYDEAKGMM